MIFNLLKYIRPLLIRILIYTEKTEKRIKPRKEYKKYYIPPMYLLLLNMALIYYILLSYVGANFVNAVVCLLVVLFITFLLITYLNISHPQIISDKTRSILILFLLFTYISALVIWGNFFQLNPYLFPIASLAVLLGLLIQNIEIALIPTLILTTVLGILTDSRAFLFHIPSSTCFIYLTMKTRHRTELLKSGLFIVFLNLFLVFVCDAIFNKPISAYNFIHATINGIISTLLTLALITPLEEMFSILTNFKLIELADFNQPLLNRLMLEAPGTYHHSLITASLSEQAANVIGANPLLLRVAAYYHDVGKLIKPEYFIENQLGAENPHDLLPTTMSGLIIISHLKEGTQILKEAGLNESIIEIIQQHHGTSKVYSLDTEEYRYPGPKPSSKEAAVLMISDACEAAVRQLKSPTQQGIKDTVYTVVNSKLMDGQFEDAPITIQELYKVTDSIANALITVYHSREYKKT